MFSASCLLLHTLLSSLVMVAAALANPAGYLGVQDVGDSQPQISEVVNHLMILPFSGDDWSSVNVLGYEIGLL